MPTRVDHEQRRRQIAEALLRIAATRGLQAASMREVAAEAGVSLRLVQYYFSTKDELLLGSLPYLGERLTARVQARLEGLGKPPSPRQVIEAVLFGVLPTDEESRAIRTTYDAFYALVLTDPGLAARHEAHDPAALERLLARQVELSQQAGEIAAGEDAGYVAAVLLALTNGLGASVIGGQRGGDAASAVLRHHLDQLFDGR
ncbi:MULTISPECIES: TetR/AcrR family transcriptional regulator [unclassified Modestobacter]|uniref:TetR/AcrR family transcriptional regulator n=1 Tax=unclassified Modestobacter TaxID=2643866 RepID=UPI0022AA1E07|nr:MULTISPECIES: TetR family transcriptional regulator C-terminal domain-containing protein [unclassified Modestobacter]MCZ2813610.1 TetR family transcriptional regulator C-terminal domain-containing protein [Modestobacter sp. VKM Ac-2979]MCZ2842198.1 TetR family transcriptional regulator C-terminal domain-containing protein [Modestobacter sp. VKM Ac-2980]MCZ2846767.1 TetR family transcriptional regulator C-terminal domain-containing protein [Modestobacter sp. VKM Ac-2978]